MGAEHPEVAKEIDLPVDVVKARLSGLGSGSSKFNLRGARWHLVQPALSNLLSRAVFEAFAKEKAAGASLEE